MFCSFVPKFIVNDDENIFFFSFQVNGMEIGVE